MNSSPKPELLTGWIINRFYGNSKIIHKVSYRKESPTLMGDYLVESPRRFKGYYKCVFKTEASAIRHAIEIEKEIVANAKQDILNINATIDDSDKRVVVFKNRLKKISTKE